MRKGSLLAALVMAGLVAAALVGLVGPEGAAGAPDKKATAGTLEIRGLTPGQPVAIDVIAWSWGLSVPIFSGGGGGGGAGPVNVQDMSFTKALDELSPEIVESLATGRHLPGATLLVDADGLPGSEPTHRYEFDDVLFSSVSQGGSGGAGQMTENVTIHFDSFEFTNE
jgi:type VI protein secretion system component Hcp